MKKDFLPSPARSKKPKKSAPELSERGAKAFGLN
jgi:hypothetical protein